MKLTFKGLICSAMLGGLFLCLAVGQTATSFEIKKSNAKDGKLYITVKGKKTKISDTARRAWLINQGKEVAFTATETFGVESFQIYNFAKRKSRTLISQNQDDAVGLSEVKLSNGKTALLVKMFYDNRFHLAIINPLRGKVFYQQDAELAQISGDFMTVSFYKEESWKAVNKKRSRQDLQNKTAYLSRTKANPYKIQKFDLRKVLNNPVIEEETID